MQRQIHRIYRRIWVGFASIGMLALGAALCGCGDSDTSVTDVLSPSASAEDASSASINFDEVLDSLELSEDQRSGIDAALARFRDSQARGPRGGRRGGPRVGGGAEAWAEHVVARREAVMTLVETVGEILQPEQTAVFVEYLAEKREEMRAQFEARMEERRARFEDRRGQFGGMAGRGPLAELDLSDAQKESVRAAMATFRTGVREILDSVRAGQTSIDDAIAGASDLAQVLRSELAGTLTEDQMSALEEWKSEKVEQRVRVRLDRLAEAMERRVEFLIKVLHLDDVQAATVSDLVQDTIPAREALLGQLLAGTIEPATMGLQILRIERALKDDISEILTPEQQAAIDAVMQLLPENRPPSMMR